MALYYDLGMPTETKIKDQTLESLDYTLSHIYLTDRSRKEYKLEEEPNIIAAEPLHDDK